MKTWTVLSLKKTPRLNLRRRNLATQSARWMLMKNQQQDQVRKLTMIMRNEIDETDEFNSDENKNESMKVLKP